MQLNTEQEKAKNKIEGPVLILAGAGSGKTATLTARVEHMINNRGITPSSILVVTFTNKAANEMKQRVSKVIGATYNKNVFKNHHLPFVGTFHGFGVFILKEKIDTLGFSRNFIIYDDSDKISLIKNIIKEDLGLDDKKYQPRYISSIISNAKNSLITVDKYANYIDSHIKEIVYTVYEQYDKRLKENNALDFDDILIYTLEILKNKDNLEYYQEKYRYIMVDEYQDTNAPQYSIIKLLASKYRNLAVVGDDWQSIYSWRGADMRNIINFKKDYPDALEIKLEQNYRSTKSIINAANTLIKNNKSSLDKTLFTDNENGQKITYVNAPSDRIENKTIAEIIKSKGDNYKENLILYRTNSQSRGIEESLIMEGIPYKIIGGLKFYDRAEVKDILSYLKIIHNPNDIIAMKRIINVPTRKIGNTTIKKLDVYKDNFGINYIQIFSNLQEVEGLKPSSLNALMNFNKIFLDLIEKSKTFSLIALIDEIIDTIGYKDYLRYGATNEEYEARMDNIGELKNVASSYNGIDPRDALSQFLDEVSLVSDLDNLSEENNFVTLMTIHTAKGLEYERVFITGLEDGLFPISRSFDNFNELEEERRLMYVAMTRAKKELYLSSAIERFQYGNFIRNPASRFISEINKELIQDYEFSFNSSLFSNTYDIPKSDTSVFKIKRNIIENDVSSFSIGDRVLHPKFGPGSILSLNGDIAEIKFLVAGVKKMNIKIAPVKKDN